MLFSAFLFDYTRSHVMHQYAKAPQSGGLLSLANAAAEPRRAVT